MSSQNSPRRLRQPGVVIRGADTRSHNDYIGAPPSPARTSGHSAAPQPTIDSLQREIRRLTRQVEELRDAQEAAAVAQQEAADTNQALFVIVNMLREEVRTALDNMDRSFSPLPDDESVLEPVIIPPEFNPNASKFYVVAKGRAPGIYSDHGWASQLIEKLPFDQRRWCRVYSLADAWKYWDTQNAVGAIEITGRTPGDLETYGPASYQLPPRT
ncbi:hypothetical protein DFP72DRAFT_1080450 [Ephemerocybe angulata]|uniref:Ribonuclease H1 N-terminal domain-containing protein n=1 Tax=Ephemerocybe angulata TaxID=980116 RepID=A0A8H6LWG6_9AGAR|nr:hypothetical protein DFP72DRAFT_1080450 [Tulosesus angulatus]